MDAVVIAMVTTSACMAMNEVVTVNVENLLKLLLEQEAEVCT